MGMAGKERKKREGAYFYEEGGREER